MARPARYSLEVRERAVRMAPRNGCALESDNRLPADVTENPGQRHRHGQRPRRDRIFRADPAHGRGIVSCPKAL